MNNAKSPYMQPAPETLFELENFVPSLQEVFEQRRFNSERTLQVAIPVREPAPGGPLVPAIDFRELVSITDGESFWHWEADSLRALFRGDRQPPVLGDYPAAYSDSFILLDLHVLEISRVVGDRRDEEMREIYSWLRRLPDGRSHGFVHDYMWQAAALVLGTRPLSQAEFEAILARLERSCRTFNLGSSSRNYVTTLKNTLGRACERPSSPQWM